MEYINQWEDVILFEYGNRRWEIKYDIPTSEETIQSHIQRRINELEKDFQEWGDYDHSDLYVDFCEYKTTLENDGNNN